MDVDRCFLYSSACSAAFLEICWMGDFWGRKVWSDVGRKAGGLGFGRLFGEGWDSWGVGVAVLGVQWHTVAVYLDSYFLPQNKNPYLPPSSLPNPINKLIIKSQMQEALNFCNQYLMLKLLSTLEHPQPTSTPISVPTTNRKVHKGRVENPHRKIGVPTGESLQGDKKIRRKKFQGAGLKKDQHDRKRGLDFAKEHDEQMEGERQLSPQHHPHEESEEENNQDHGYVPIQNLLSQLTGKNQRRNQNTNININTNYNNYNSFNNYDTFDKNKNYYPKQKTSYQFSNPTHLSSNWSQPYIHPTPSSSILQALFPNCCSSKNLHQPQPSYLCSSPSSSSSHFPKPSQLPTPPTLSNKKSLQYSDSFSNISLHHAPSHRLYNHNQDTSRSKSRKKRNADREFYLPVTVEAAQGGDCPREREVTRCASTNKMIAKLEREVQEQKEMEKSRISDTRFQTKNKYHQSRELEDYSAIQLDNAVRQSLSFVSEINFPNTPPTPINIQLRR